VKKIFLVAAVIIVSAVISASLMTWMGITFPGSGEMIVYDIFEMLTGAAIYTVISAKPRR